MGDYITIDDLRARVSEQSLIELTDEAGMGVVDEGKVNRAIEDAEEVINSYLRGRYFLPISPVPKLLKTLAVDIALYLLYARTERFDLAELPGGVTAQYKNAIKILENIQKGLVTLGTEQGVTSEPGEYRTSKTADDRIFTKDVMEDF